MPCERDFRQVAPGTPYNDPRNERLEVRFSSFPSSFCLSREETKRDKKRRSYKAVNCLRRSISLKGTAGRLAGETTVKSLIDDLHVNAREIMFVPLEQYI